MTIQFRTPEVMSHEDPLRLAIYGYNGTGKTTLAGKTGLRTILIDCRDAGVVTLRDAKNVKVVRITSILNFLEVMDQINRMSDSIDLLVVDTVTGLQSMAIREVKGKRNFDMNQRKWGQAGSRVIECITEASMFSKDVIYLIQERKKTKPEDETKINIMPSLTPSVREYLSSVVDWVGRLSLDGDGRRVLDFRLTEDLEAKDRAGLFPKLIVNPNYLAIRKRIKGSV